MRGVILAGGGGQRLSGVLKPTIPVGGTRMIDRVIAALADCESIIVVGPPALMLPADVDYAEGSTVPSDDVRFGEASPRVARTQEMPPGGGPVAGIGAAFEALRVAADGSAPRRPGNGDWPARAAPPVLTDRLSDSMIAIVGGDLPLLTVADVTTLVAALADDDDGSVYVDETGRPQWLCGVWRTEALIPRLETFGELRNGSLRALFGPMRFAEVAAGDERMPPFFDCDTVHDIRQAEEWLRR